MAPAFPLKTPMPTLDYPSTRPGPLPAAYALGYPGGMRIQLPEHLEDPTLRVMNFLNEVTLAYPEAISFAPGRPAARFFDVEGQLGEIGRYVDERVAATGAPRASVVASLGQYGRTNGFIHELIARQLELDEGIRVDPRAIVVTTGCQEAMAILLAGLFERGRDALLVSDPTYIGITGLATILGVDVVPVASGPAGLEPASVEAALAAARAAGLRPRALYDIPDFNNPLGSSLPLAARRAVLELAVREELLVFEDNPYGMFAYDAAPLPTLKSLDEAGVVVYLGSFSKTLFPGLRLGYLVADQTVARRDGGTALLADELSKVKSLTTVNTSSLGQAVVGGILLRTGGSLAPLLAEKLPHYRGNRDRLLAALAASFGEGGAGEGLVRWNRPAGGFFLTLDLPFAFDEDCLQAAARDYGIVCCPMSFFTVRRTPERDRQVRLSFSAVTPDEIAEGVRRLAAFVHDRMRGRMCDRLRSGAEARTVAAPTPGPAEPAATAPAADRSDHSADLSAHLSADSSAHLADPEGRVPAAALARVLLAALRRRGLSEEHAGFVADGLLETSLRGVDTHGIRLVPTYLAELDGGRAAAAPSFIWSGAAAARRLDAGGALGHVAGRVACREVVRLARAHGVGVVVVANSNHFGAASCYVLELARAGLVGLAASSADSLVAPFGGLAPFLGTDPLALAAPGLGEEVFCADFATSQVAYSRLRDYRARGLPPEPGWAIGPGGADAAIEGEAAALAPLGGQVAGHKGQALGLMVEILSALLAGAPADHRLSHLFDPPFDRPRQVAHFFLGIDSEALAGGSSGDVSGDLTGPGAFRGRLSALLADLRAQPARPGSRVLAPGDPEAAAAAERRARGIPLRAEEFAWWGGLAQELGEPFP
jgi:(S)-3,5-dihydroxyphenylglycine transaminase